MTSTVYSEGFYSGAFLVREDVGFLSRDAGVMANPTGADAYYPGGLVVSAAPPTNATAAPIGVNTGNGTFGTITVSAPATAGAYVVNLESATGFTVESPTGQEIGHGQVGAPFAVGGLGFTITAGSTAFVAGDSFTITVPPGAGGYVPFTGAAPAVALLFSRTFVPAGGTNRVALISRHAEVNAAEIQWDPSVASNTAAQAAALAQLATQSIQPRGTPPTAG